MQTTVVGNYPKIPNRPRPGRYRNALNKRDRGEITNEELAEVANEVTIEVIQEQIDAGVDIVTDGQIRWDDDQRSAPSSATSIPTPISGKRRSQAT
jgi:5-methyltetrahydropteroyltriglutamate--homocysteine methyltransferase